MKKLYKISFKDYLNNNPEIRSIEYGVQEKRYRHQENRRLEKIQKAIERRRDIIEHPDKVFSTLKNKF